MSSILGRKSSKNQEQLIRDGIGSLGIQVQPVAFDPERNVYELRFELPDCPKDLIKVTYDRPSGKLKVQGQNRLKRDFLYEVTVPSDCNANEIYGRFRGDVLTIIMPRSKTDLHSKPALISKQEEVERVSSDGKTAEKGKEKAEKGQELPAEVPVPPPSDLKTTGRSKKYQESASDVPASRPPDQKMTDRVKERVEKYQKLLAEIIAQPSSNQKTTEKATERVERDQKLPASVPAPPPLPSPPGQKTTEKIGEAVETEQKSPTEAPPAPSPSDPKMTKNVSESVQKNKESTANMPTPQPPSDQKMTKKVSEEAQRNQESPANVTAPQSTSDQKTTDKITKEVKGGQESPPKIPAPQSPSDQKTEEQKDVESKSKSHQEEMKTPDVNLKGDESISKPEKKPDREVPDRANTEQKNEEKKSAGNEKGVVAAVKETAMAAILEAKKEENRPWLVIGAVALAIVIIGLRSGRKVQN